MAEFASLHSYQHFEQSVKAKARFVYDTEIREFLESVVETIKPKRLKKLPNGKPLFRAQRGFTATTEPMHLGEGDDEEIDSTDVKVALGAEFMIPKAEFAGDGRVNPRGIPCLYLASTPSAAIAEMRPWIGSYITLAQFKTVRDCLLVDCSINTVQSDWLEPVDPDGEGESDSAKKENGVWGDIGFAFSKPVTYDEPHLDYVPTQILAETFRYHGYDGILYKSLLDEAGNNIALFDSQSANLTSCCLYEIKAASLESVKRESIPTTWPDPIHSKFRRGRIGTP